MINRIINKLKEKAAEINWPLLGFLLLVLNVKLVVKVAAILIISIINRKDISVRHFFRQRFVPVKTNCNADEFIFVRIIQ